MFRDDEGELLADQPWLWDFMEYQSERLSTELGFFSKPSEALKILRSPAASMSTIENVVRFFDSAFNFNERFERGPWKGQRKIEKYTVNLIPIYKQYYRARDIKEQVPWLR